MPPTSDTAGRDRLRTGTSGEDRRGERTAHPYLDTEVIDARAPRFNQATVGVLSLIALLTGWWWLFALLALQLVLGLTLGRKFCLPCVFYFEVIQPRIGEGEVEDSRPPRFANILGAVFLSAATVAHVAGLTLVGNVLGGIVAALALLAATTGLCVGCELYRVGARLRGIRPGSVDRLDLDDFEPQSEDEVVVAFSHPLCTGCRELEEGLRDKARRLLVVNVAERPDLARKYHVSVVPRAFVVARNGAVLEVVR
jgi:hypothetical protein